MAVNYKLIPPTNPQDSWTGNGTALFETVLPNEVYHGNSALFGNLRGYSTGNTLVDADDDIYFDHLTGAHGLVADIETIIEGLGIVEHIQVYPRWARNHGVLLLAEEGLGTDTNSAQQLICPSPNVAKGLLEGITVTAEDGIPFVIPLQYCLNTLNNPIAGNDLGKIKVRINFARNDDFLAGSSVTANSNYQVTNLKMGFSSHTDPSYKTPAGTRMTVIESYAPVIDTDNFAVETFANPCRGVLMNFVKTTDLNDATKNHYVWNVPPGAAPLGANPRGLDTKHYGLEKITYSINDTETALIDYTLESREEIMANGLACLGGKPAQHYNALIRHMQDPVNPDCYVAGINFGGLVDFTRNKFSARLESKISSTDQYNAHLYFLTEIPLMA